MRHLSFLLILLTLSAYSQKNLSHIDPPFWWAKMPIEELQLMLHGDNIGNLSPELSYAGIEIIDVQKLENPKLLNT